MGIFDNIFRGVTSENDRARDRAFRNAAGDAGRLATEAVTGNRAAGRAAEAVLEGRANERTVLNSGRAIYNEEQRRTAAEERDRARQERETQRRAERLDGREAQRAARKQGAETTAPETATPAVRETKPSAAPASAAPAATAPVAAAAVTETTPSVAAADPTATNYFWNAYSNIQAEVGPPGGYDFNRELLTYIQADERYLSHMESYADMQGLTGAERTTLLEAARVTHRESYDTLETSPGYSTDMQGAANDFYFVIEQAAATAPAPVIAPESPAPLVETPTAPTAVLTSYTPAPVVDTAPELLGAPEATTTTPVAPQAPATPDTSFTETQLGSLAQAPEGGITDTPITAPIAVEDMPIPLSHEEKLELGRQQEDTSTVAEYTVERGDNLWKIAQDYYGLDDPKHIQTAVETIAAANNMSDGVKANHLSIGQVLKLPDSPTPVEGQAGLNWAALDADTATRLKGSFNGPAAGTELAQDTPQVDVDRTATGPTIPAQQGNGGMRFA